MQRASSFYYGGNHLDPIMIFRKGNDCASYSHFDYKVSLNSIIDKVSDRHYISHHSFKPLIHVEKKIVKFDSKTKKRKIKCRQIFNCSHFDRCIYQYYSYEINNKYNEIAKKYKINNAAIAYRNNTSKNNIHFAKQVFSFIKRNTPCIVFVGDFTNFFDKLNHKYLKNKLCEVLEEEEKLPEDYYQVYKSITKYAYVEKENAEKYKESIENNSKKTLFSMKELRKNKSLIQYNRDDFGIPQGVSISAILSNVYMIDFDRGCQSLAKKYGGLYLRYCDDFIIAFPNKEIMEVNKLYQLIMDNVAKIPNLILSAEKTRIYYCSKDKIISCEKEIGSQKNSKNSIDYLGFTYNGKKVSIRDKTIGKYYYRMYKKIKTINKQRENKEFGGGTRKLYLLYSAKGNKPEDGNKNFISYVCRCKKIFGPNENVHRVLNVHYGKIKKRLKKEGE